MWEWDENGLARPAVKRTERSGHIEDLQRQLEREKEGLRRDRQILMMAFKLHLKTRSPEELGRIRKRLKQALPKQG